MTRLTVDAALQAKLENLAECVELCDESGRTLGYFTPDNASFYQGVDPPISEEELDRREKLGGGRPLEDILADLEKRQQ